MQHKKLFLEDGTAVKPRICSGCNRIWESEESAERCCKCSYCGKQCDWSKGTSHPECLDAAFRQTETNRMAKAVLVEDYDGPFLIDEHTLCMTTDKLFQMIEPDELDEEGFCTRYQPARIELENVLEQVGSEMYEDWEGVGNAELETAIDEWNAKNVENGTYFEDHKRKWSKACLLQLAGIEAE